MKKLDLNAIAEEVLDECFASEEVNTLEALDSIEVQEEEPKVSKGKYNISLKRPFGVTNEDLIKEIREGINVKKNTELLLRYNYGMIVDVASKCTCYIPFEDKISYGVEGFMRAIKTFDLSKNVKFITYATSSVYMTMYNEGTEAVQMVHFPRYMSVHNIKVNRFVEDYQKKNGKRPQAEVISEATDIDIQHVKNCLLYNFGYTSLDTKMNSDSENTLADVITSKERDYILNVNSISTPLLNSICELINELPEKDRELIVRIHGIGNEAAETIREVAENGYVDAKGNPVPSRSSVHRKYSEAMDKLKKLVTQRGFEYEDF